MATAVGVGGEDVRVGVRLDAALEGGVVVGSAEVADPLGTPLLLVGPADGLDDAEGVATGELESVGSPASLEQAARPRSSSSAAAVRPPVLG